MDRARKNSSGRQRKSSVHRSPDSDHLIKDYWHRRLRTPKGMTLLVNSLTTYVQIMTIKAARTDLEVAISKWLMLLSLLIYALILPSLFNKKFNGLVRYGFMLLCFRIIAYNYNLFQNKHIIPFDEWALYCQFQAIAAMYLLHYHFHNFDHRQWGYHLFSLVYMNLLFFAAVASVGQKDLLQLIHGLETKKGFIFLALIYQIGIFVSQYFENEHNLNLINIIQRSQQHEFLKLVIDNHTDSLVIVNDEHQITYSNPVFRRVFHKAITQSIAKDAHHVSSSSSSVDILDEAQWGCLSAAVRYLKRRMKKLQKLLCRRRKDLSSIEERMHSLFIQINEGLNTEALEEILDMKLFRQEQDSLDTASKMQLSSKISGGQDFSFRELLTEKKARDGQVFRLVEPTLLTHFESHHLSRQTSLEERTEDSIYIKVLFTTLVIDSHERTLVRLVDVTDSIMIDKTQAQNELLALINATVSHELRNPLNSIVAQNVAKEGLYHQMKAIISTSLEESSKLNLSESNKVLDLLEQLQESLSIQDSSAKLMSFLVQDFLDYAQIKSGKFRINIKPFDIRKAVQSVMSIQMEKAQAQQLDFHAEFLGISEETPEEASPLAFSNFQRPSSKYSPVIYCDEQRVMQVLLNIQSNALKFTQKGSVIVTIEIEQKEGDEYLKISVTDTGLGVPYEDQRKLFKLFGFVQSTVEVNRNGIGLGLVISEQIVKKFGGSITFTSVPSPEPNHGSTFSFTFKLTRQEDYELSPIRGTSIKKSNVRTLNSKHLVYDWEPEDDLSDLQSHVSSVCEEQKNLEAPATRELQFNLNKYNSLANSVSKDDSMSARLWKATEEHEESSPPPPQRRKTQSAVFKEGLELQEIDVEVSKEKKVLIVDDQIFNIRALQIILEYKFGMGSAKCQHAFNGEQALEIVRKDIQLQKAYGFQPQFPLILLDCNMPVMDGYEASYEIRKLYWKELRVPIERQPIISAVTGHTEQMHIQKCFKHGMNQALSKPIEASALRVPLRASGLLD